MTDPTPHAGHYTLPLDTDLALMQDSVKLDGELPGFFADTGTHFPPALIIRNARWFCRLRWGILAILGIIGVLGLFARHWSTFYTVGIRPNAEAFLSIAGALFVANLAYVAHLRKLGNDSPLRPAQFNLWSQIAIDLFATSWVIHLFGSIETYLPFLYLLHIVLACIFFPRRYSLIVMLTAFSFYLMILGLEVTGTISPQGGIYLAETFRQGFGELQIIVNLITLFSLLFTVWYLTSRVAAIIHQRDRELADTNDQLLKTQTDKARHMLRTTHELKAPFAAIHANTQLLLNGYCGTLPHDAEAVVKKIADRARRLSAEIQEMLQLANLTTVDKDTLRWVKLDMEDVLKKSIDQIRVLATEKGITLKTHLQSSIVSSVEDHLIMLFTNLISNAVYYSNKGGVVTVSCEGKLSGKQKVTRVYIEDTGIGIPAEKLPKIFDEYYRTEEAAAHNKDSSGIGLAIVKTIAVTHHVSIQVDSTQHQGTRFTLEVPVNTQISHTQQPHTGLKHFQRIAHFLRGGHN